MKIAICFAAILFGVAASPEGYYHQEYNYKTSSSSFKNNELQHKTDDQGYYRKQGDLAGRLKPKVVSNSEHSEYINPKLREGAAAGYYDAETDLTSSGNLLANSYGAALGGEVSSGYQIGSRYGSDQYTEGLASSDHIAGASGVYGAYGSGSQVSYGSSSLRTVASRLQNELQREIQAALREQQSQYSHRVEISELEAELRRNLTARLNEILQDQFGTQTIRGGQSYSLVGGRLDTRPNYEQHDLEALQRSIENSLLQQLRQEYRTSQSSHHQAYTENYARYESTTYRPATYKPIYPNLNTITTEKPFPVYPGGSSSDHVYSQSEYHRASSNVRYTPVSNPLSITTIASNIQTNLDSFLNKELERIQNQLFSGNTQHSSYVVSSELDNLQQELRNNLTHQFEEELRRQYGTQVLRDGYLYSVGPRGEISQQYNYNAADLESLRKQVTDNLITKLTRDFESAKRRWSERISSASYIQNQYSTSENHGYDYYSTPRHQYSTPRYEAPAPTYGYENYHRPTSPSIVPLISSGVKGGKQYEVISGTHEAEYEYSGSSGNVAQLQRQLQADLGRQLQAAISQNSAVFSRYSSGSSGSYGSRTFEEAYQRLYDELQRNLTQQLQEFTAGGSSYSTSYGSVSDAQLANLRAQLQRNLASQLQQGLQQSYSASASYSASSGSSASAGAYSSSSSGGSYRSARGDNYQQGYSGYGQYRSGGNYPTQGEDCLEDNPQYYHRAKRSYGYRSRPLGLSTHSGSGYNSYGGYSTGYNGNFGGSYGRHQPLQSVGQEEDDSDLTHHQEEIGQQEINIGQEIDNDDEDTQRIVNHGFDTFELGSASNKLQIGGQRQVELGQEVDDEDTQKIEDIGFGKLEAGSYIKPTTRPRPNYGGGYGRLEFGSQHHSGLENIETQQSAGSNLHKYQSQVSTSNLGQEVDDSDITQKVEDVHFGGGHVSQNLQSLNYPGVSKPTGQNVQSVGQEVDDSDLTHQLETSSFGVKPAYGTFEFGSHNYVGLKPLSQSSGSNLRYPGYRRVELGSQSTRQTVSSYQLTSTKPTVGQISNNENTVGHNVQSQGQEVDDSDLIQQVEEIDFGVNTRKPGYQGFDFGSQSQIGQQTRPFQLPNKPQSQPSSQAKPVGQNQQSIGQEVDDSDLTRQVEDAYFGVNIGKPGFELGSESQTGPYQSPNYKPQISYQAKPAVQNQQLVGQEVDDSDLTQQVEDAQFGINIGKPSYGNFDSQSHIGQKTDDTETIHQQDFSINYNKPISTEPNRLKPIGQNLQPAGQHLYNLGLPQQTEDVNFEGSIRKPIGQQTTPVTNSKPVFQKPINQNVQPVGQETDDSDLYQRTEDVNFVSTNQQPGFGGIAIGSSLGHQTDNTQLTHNVEDTQFSQFSPLILGNNRPYLTSQTSTPRPLTFSSQVKTISEESETRLKKQLEDIIQSKITHASPPQQIYQSILLELQNNINNESQNILRQHSNTQINQREVNQYLTYTLQETLRRRLQSLGFSRESMLIETTYSQKPVDVYNFIQGEINSQNGDVPYKPILRGETQPSTTPKQTLNIPNDDEVVRGDLSSVASIKPAVVHTQVNGLPTTEQALIKPSTPKSNPAEDPFDLANFPPLPPPSSSHIVPISTTTNRPWQVSGLDDAEREADLLIQKLREAQRNRQTQSESSITYGNSYGSSYNSYQQRNTPASPVQHQVVSVTLENITPDQLSLIGDIDQDFTNLIDVAIENHMKKYVSSHSSYQSSLRILERELIANITNCINGKFYASSTTSAIADFEKYSYLIKNEFDHSKLSDLNKYLEIKLVKKLREKLRKAYNLESVYSTSYNAPAVYEVTQVRLENISPAQLRIINQLEKDFEQQLQLSIENQIKSGSRQENYHVGLNNLEAQLKRNITESLELETEPGLGKYAEFVTLFDEKKRADVEKYLQIRLLKKLMESLQTHFHVESGIHASSNQQYHTASTNHYQIRYGQTGHFSHNFDDVAEEIESVEPQHATIISPGAPVYHGGVKGSKPINHDVESISTSYHSQNSLDQERLAPEEVTETDEPTTTQQPSWWKRFGNKVKQSATNLKEKIVGKS